MFNDANQKAQTIANHANSIAAQQGYVSGQILGGGGGAGSQYTPPTVLEAIDQRIESMNENIRNLQRMKNALAEPSGILKLSVNDLRFLTNL